ncbi:MAG TPA: hypothetical protein VFJ06_04485 [Halococcus sp.]|nr:hypothetical protein [Halococcus sp.]
MSHDDNDTDTRIDPFDTDESNFNIAVMGKIGSGTTVIDPKGEGGIECPLGDHPAANETASDSPEDDDERQMRGDGA